jgi:succinyl-CoA synthetase alpha subunit
LEGAGVRTVKSPAELGSAMHELLRKRRARVAAPVRGHSRPVAPARAAKRAKKAAPAKLRPKAASRRARVAPKGRRSGRGRRR